MEHDLKTIPEYTLKAHPKSEISEIHSRMDDLDLKYLRRVVYKMYNDKILSREGIRSNMVYFIAK